MTDFAKPADACLNCGRAAPEEYCQYCGQETRERRAPFRHLVRELFDHLSIDSKLPKSLLPLIVRPGRLTEAYLSGKRASFVPPLRMYIVLSLIFFLLMSIDPPDADNYNLYVGDELVGAEAPSESKNEMRIGVNDEHSWLGRRLASSTAAKEEQLRQMDPQDLIDDLYYGVQASLSKALFAFLPLLALVLKVLFRRSLYFDHLIFALHTQSLLFLCLSLALVVQSVGLYLASIFLILPLYLLLALKRVYRERWLWIFGKLFLLMISYVFLLGLVIGGVFAYVIWTI